MASTKDRLEGLETSSGMMQDEMQRMSTAMVDMKGELDDKFRKMEENFTRLMEAVTSSRDDGGSNASRGSRRPEHTPPNTGNARGDQVNPFAPITSRRVKLEFPRFSGGDPTEWVSKVKQFFEYQEMAPEQHVSFTSFHLDGVANEWWQAISKALREDQVEITWEVFEEELWARFGPTDGEDFHEALSRVRQTGSLSDYQQEFERLQNKVRGWSQQALVGTFMGGLQPEIADGIRMFRPKTLKEIINYVRLMDGQLQRLKRMSPSKPAFRSFTPSRPMTTREPQTPTQGPKKLSWEELKKKRSLGLCFSCDERYTPGHKCKQPQLFIMEGEQDDDMDIEDDDEIDPKPEITVYALAGWDTANTIRIQAQIRKQELIALVDSGSTHNFISEKAARRLNLSVTPISPFSVRVADGKPLICRHRFEAVSIQMGGATFTVTLYALPLVGLDLVMGIQWLQSLGPTLCDWRAQTMRFHWTGQEITLKGIQALGLRPTTQESMSKEARQGQTIFAISMAHDDEQPSPVPDEMRCLVTEFTDLFAAPSQLPPDHAQRRNGPSQCTAVPLCLLPKRRDRAPDRSEEFTVFAGTKDTHTRAATLDGLFMVAHHHSFQHTKWALLVLRNLMSRWLPVMSYWQNLNII
ncbi:hypothetical protein EUTSA_v10012141mg [Eutrema salsugineum]|uniref:Retrotransposon gag domain-containing protein n=1 Tax=Eutrema salsugineum TaxID=72664 RepID=V4KHZ5_EUTSA|nr:hypothetical protein EUTSA_v10012141mg [Eutrema salsugineum]